MHAQVALLGQLLLRTCSENMVKEVVEMLLVVPASFQLMLTLVENLSMRFPSTRSRHTLLLGHYPRRLGAESHRNTGRAPCTAEPCSEPAGFRSRLCRHFARLKASSERQPVLALCCFEPLRKSIKPFAFIFDEWYGCQPLVCHSY